MTPQAAPAASSSGKTSFTLSRKSRGWAWGWGELDYAHFITLYPGARFCEILDNAHNLPLHLAVELGLPLALLACATLVWLIARQRPWAERDPHRQTAWAILAVIGLHSMLEYPLWYGPFQMTVLLCIWILWVAPRSDSRPNPVSQPCKSGAEPKTQCAAVQDLPPKAAGLSALPQVQLSDTATPATPAKSVVPNWPLARTCCALAATVLLAVTSYASWDYYRISQIYLPVEERAAAYKEDTLSKIQGSRLFHDQVAFAELTITPLTTANAPHLRALALEMLHFSPEPRVIEKLVESTTLLGNAQEALVYLERYRAAFPKEHALWSAQQLPPAPKLLLPNVL